MSPCTSLEMDGGFRRTHAPVNALVSVIEKSRPQASALTNRAPDKVENVAVRHVPTPPKRPFTDGLTLADVSPSVFGKRSRSRCLHGGSVLQ